MLTLVALIAWFVIGFTLVYVFSLTASGLHAVRVAGHRLREQASDAAAPQLKHALSEALHTYYLIPCLNEELVIGRTIERLLADQPPGTVVVIDDASDDATPQIVRSHADQGVVLLRRELPEARLGKGKALNHAYSWVAADAARHELDPHRVLVCVLDADGQLSPGATEQVSRVFADDDSVGGVQLVVRIRNRERLITRFQDMEFWAMSGVGQLGRVVTGTVSMGGNGQYTRLRALAELGDEPWSSSLTEDLELGVQLSILGWRTSSTIEAHVSQQAVESLRLLLRQRTRWYQGHMMTIGALPKLLTSRYTSNLAAVELSCYLLVPWLITLPWSIIQQVLLILLATGDLVPVYLGATGVAWVRGLLLLGWYLLSFAPHLFWGLLYWRRTPGASLWRGLLMAHLMVPWSYVAYLAAWRAFARILLRKNRWTKTARVAEAIPAGHDLTTGQVPA